MCRATEIHICSNFLPENWWGEKTKFNREAVDRRITVVHYHDKYKHFFLYKSDEESSAMDKLRTKLNSVHYIPINHIL